MEKKVMSLYQFLLRAIFVLLVLFTGVVILQIVIYLGEVQKAEDQVFASWSNQDEVNQYKIQCEKGPISREERNSKTRLVTKFDCAKENASIDLANALVRAHASIPEPPPPLKYL